MSEIRMSEKVLRAADDPGPRPVDQTAQPEGQGETMTERRYEETLRSMHQCRREPPSHTMLKYLADRVFCHDCREWCDEGDMACSGCRVRQALTPTEEGK